MRVFRGVPRLGGNWRRAITVIGNFDGLHRGHQALIDAARSLARDQARPLGLITFEPHPRQVIMPDQAPLRLTPVRRKLELARALGIEFMVLIPFSRNLMATSAREFVLQILGDRLGVRALMAGEDFRFGRDRAGDLQALEELGRQVGIEVHSVPKLQMDHRTCSSSHIRDALALGHISDVNAMLGHDYQIIGMVRTGDRRGRELGFPTANTYPLPSQSALPATGIYTVSARPLGSHSCSWLDAVASLGRNPTFGGKERRLEVHILDRQGLGLYGQRLRVAFIERLRGEIRFDSVDALVAQMRKDCDQARDTHRRRRDQASA